MNTIDSQLAEAVVLFTGWGKEMHPKRDRAVLEKKYGKGLAETLFVRIKALEDDFYSTDARLTAKDLAEMAMSAEKDFAVKHPELPSEIGRAFAWCYTYDNK